MRRRHPKPTVGMSAATAERLFLAEGDEVLISRQDTPSRWRSQYVHPEYGRWRGIVRVRLVVPLSGEGRSADYSGCLESNVNLLMRGTVPMDPEPLIGTWICQRHSCRIRKKERE